MDRCIAVVQESWNFVTQCWSLRAKSYEAAFPVTTQTFAVNNSTKLEKSREHNFDIRVYFRRGDPPSHLKFCFKVVSKRTAFVNCCDPSWEYSINERERLLNLFFAQLSPNVEWTVATKTTHVQIFRDQIETPTSAARFRTTCIRT